jgi:hypothetical protein
MGILTDLGLPDDVSNFLGGLFETGANYAAADDVINRLSKVGGTLAEGFPKIGQEAFEKSRFQPFTVTSGTGSTSALTDPITGEFSGVSNTLGAAGTAQQKGIQNIISGMLGGGGGTFSPIMSTTDIRLDGSPTVDNRGKFINNQTGEIRYGEPAQPMFTSATPTSISDQAFGGVGSLLTSVTGDRGTREQSIYDRIRATQTPEEDRQRQLLNDQLLNQGRLGLSTAMFGGSPEQFAQEKARAEAMNQASLAAMGQAGQERAQDLATATGLFGLGSQGSMLPLQLQGMEGQNLAAMMGLQYMPEQMMLEQLGAGTNLASIADMGRRYGAGLFDESAGAGLEGLMNTELAKADFLKTIYSNALGGGGTEGGGSWFGDIISGIFGED